MAFDYYLATNAGWRPFSGDPIISPPTPPTGSGETHPSGVWGAGFQNAGDIHPTNPLLWLTGGDVAGVHLSNDGGMSWMPNNTGLDSSDKTRTAGIMWSRNPATPNVAWLWTAGWNGSTRNYFMRGTYDPTLGVIVRWEPVHQVTGGWASAQNGTQDGDTLASGTSGHPRQTKNRMIALDEVNGVAYLGSADGMWRVNIDGTGTPTRVWGAGQSVTSISLDPLNANIAYVTVDLGTLSGVHRLTTIRTGTAPTVASHRPTAYQYAQSCKAFVRSGETRLVVATGNASNTASPGNSVVYWPGGTFTTGWSDISSNINADETGSTNRWAGVDAVMLPSGSVRLLATNSYDQTGATGKKYAEADWDFTGTPTWTRRAADYRVGDATGATWWLSENASHASLMLDRGGFDSVSPCIAPSNPDIAMLPGRSGVWRRDLADSNLWHPAVKGLAVTTSWMPLVSNQDPLKVAFADVDWTVLRSVDGMETQPMEPDRPQSAVGWNIAQSAAGKVIICLGNRDNNTDGGLWSSSNPWVGTGGWTNELGTGTGRPWTSGANTPQVKGGAIGTGAGAGQVILAALRNDTPATIDPNAGLWRKVGTGASGAWSKITLPGYANPFATTNKQLRQHFAWKDGATVWMNDPLSGLWQSRDYGATWTLQMAVTWGSIYSGHIAADPTTAGVYYALTSGNRAWKITNGDSATPTITRVAAHTANPAGVAVHPTTGNVYLAETTTARLHRSTDGGATWTDITTASWEAMCAIVKGLAIGSNGKLYTAMYSGYAITEVE